MRVSRGSPRMAARSSSPANPAVATPSAYSTWPPARSPTARPAPCRNHSQPGHPMARPSHFSAPRTAKGLVSAALSPDGQQVACLALGNIWLLRAGADPQPVIADGNFNSEPSWSADGRSLVYVSDRGGQSDIWSHNLVTGEQRQL